MMQSLWRALPLSLPHMMRIMNPHDRRLAHRLSRRTLAVTFTTSGMPEE
jgi:hypothetical protein